MRIEEKEKFLSNVEEIEDSDLTGPEKLNSYLSLLVRALVLDAGVITRDRDEAVKIKNVHKKLAAIPKLKHHKIKEPKPEPELKELPEPKKLAVPEPEELPVIEHEPIREKTTFLTKIKRIMRLE